LRRRIISVPALFIAAVVFTALLPLLLVVGVIVEALRRDRWALLRSIAMIGVYFLSEIGGMLIALGMWVSSGAPAGLGRERLRRRFITLQRWWTGSLWWGIQHCFSLKLDVEHWPEGVGDRKLLIFLRHASILDTLLSAALIANPLRMHLLYVFKRELRIDPCLDIAGTLLGCHFVNRDAGEGEQESRTLHAMGVNLREREGVIIYPEGTRWTSPKRMRVIERIAKSGDEALLERASRLQNLLPPRLSGPLALLDGAPDADVLFLGHQGFEGIEKPLDVAKGAIVGKRIRVSAWRVDAADIPREREEQVAWLYENWFRMDAWLGGKPRPAEPVAATQRS
jgi:1-acyl-sn-glycerol-3-phosphate acyltransferase